MNHKKKRFMLKSCWILFLVWGISACIGTDLIDDETVPEKITFTSEVSGVLVGGNQQLSAQYFNEFGVQENVPLSWESSDEAIVTVSSSGLITGIKEGSANIFAFTPKVRSSALPISVKGSIEDVAKITLAATKTSLKIGETLQLSAQALNVNGDVLENKTASWSSSDGQVISINSDGLATALSPGTASITATIEGVTSEALTLSSGTVTVRTGTFQNGTSDPKYVTSGTATLKKADNGDLLLELGQDFNSGFTSGTFVYLTENTTDAAQTKASGLEIKSINTGGSHTFNITSVDAGATMDKYNHVVILCKPFTIAFGFANLN